MQLISFGMHCNFN